MTALICTRPDCLTACDRCLSIRRKSRDELERALAEALACGDALVAVAGDLLTRYGTAARAEELREDWQEAQAWYRQHERRYWLSRTQNDRGAV